MMHYWGWAGSSDYWFWAIPFWFGPVLVLGILWSLFWKGLALWHSAHRGSLWWFLAFLVINTLGILEIVYLFGFAKLKWNDLFKLDSHRS